MRKLIIAIATAAVLVSASAAHADSFWYGAGVIPCRELNEIIADGVESPRYPGVIQWAMGALSIAGAAKDVRVFPASVESRAKWLARAISIRCTKNPKWQLSDTVMDMIGKLGDGDEAAAASKRPTLYQ